jgi:hypothetical protein
MESSFTNQPDKDPFGTQKAERASTPGRAAHGDEPPGFGDKAGELGSLAQSARLKQIRQAQILLVIIGILTLAVNGFMFANTENEIDQELKKAGINRAMFPRDKLDEVRRFCYTVYGAGIGIGAFFLLMGAIVKTAPVPVTIVSLVVYVLANIAFIFLNPENLAQGVVIKIVIIIGLIKAIQAAVAYEREKAEGMVVDPAS